MQFDVLVVGDPRFPGGTSTSIAAEVRALAGAGYAVGLLPVEGGVLHYPHPFNAAIASLLDEGQATLVPPGAAVAARLCTLHHPQVFASYPLRPWQIRADQTVLVVHHPPVDALGAPAYDVRAIDRILSDTFGATLWAPVGPKVRESFRGIGEVPTLTPGDWLNTIDVANWSLPRDGYMGARPVIGRHSRPDPRKWPDTRAAFLHVYPDDPGMTVRLMGYGPELDRMIGARPRNWEVSPFNARPVRAFLASIDYFVYYHGSAWIEAFGRSILEAVASGAVAVLPGHFAPLFGEAAVYADPPDVRDLVRDLHRDPVAVQRQSARGIEIVRDRFGPEHAVSRVAELIGRPRVARRAASPRSRPAKVILGSDEAPSQWRFPLAEDGTMGTLSMDNNRTRSVMNEIELIIQVSFPDSDSKEKLLECFPHYCAALTILRKTTDYTDDEIEQFQEHIDAWFCFWVEVYGREGCTNYTHLLSSSHVMHYMKEWRCLYRYSQQGWEALNAQVKAYFFRRTNRGGLSRNAEKKSKLLGIGRWLQRRIMWFSGHGDALFVDDGDIHDENNQTDDDNSINWSESFDGDNGSYYDSSEEEDEDEHE